MAATFSFGIGASLFFGWSAPAYTLEAVIAAALAALIFGRFCLGSYIFHVLKWRREFTNRTLPWAGSGS